MMTKFFNKFKKAYFWPILGQFFLKFWLCYVQLRMDSKTIPQFTKTLPFQFQENIWTEEQTDPIL